jgi:hypothetical protein
MAVLQSGDTFELNRTALMGVQDAAHYIGVLEKPGTEDRFLSVAQEDA